MELRDLTNKVQEPHSPIASDKPNPENKKRNVRIGAIVGVCVGGGIGLYYAIHALYNLGLPESSNITAVVNDSIAAVNILRGHLETNGV